MIEPPLPEDENARIETLRALRILDTATEERFDRITRLAQRIFGVRIALVNLVDSERQWFKSAQGLEGMRETPRRVSFCGHAILGDEVLHVPDARADERFHDNPLVTGEPNIRFYAGSPIRAANGRKIGTLCLIDSEPRELDDDARLLLQDLASMVEHEIASLQLTTVDALTRVANRRGFNLLGGQALALCRRQRLGASLLVFDLDNVRTVSDRVGPAERDGALRGFAGLLRESFRESDVIARVGGDKFTALLAGADARRVQGIALRFRQVLDEYNDREQRGYELSCSIGAATLQDGEDLDSLLVRADRSMYAGKRPAGSDGAEPEGDAGGTDDAWSI